MRILLIDQSGSGLDWAIRCQQDGHTVKWFLRRRQGNEPSGARMESIGDGLVEKVDDYRKWMLWADLIFFTDNSHYLEEFDHAHNRGLPVFGPSSLGSELELDRVFGQNAFKKVGIPTLPYREFSDYDTAITYVKREGKRFVSKPCGDAEKSMSYCAKSAKDMVYMLGRWKKNKAMNCSFILQEHCAGIEMAVGGWLGYNGFAPGWTENFEFKNLLNGGLGPNTGEMGTVVRVVKTSKLANKVLKPLEDDLVGLGVCGYVDVNCIIDEAGTPWPLEFTVRPGWPLFNIQQALIEGDHALWMKEILEGRNPQPWTLDTVAVGVVLAIPDFPYSHATAKEVEGIPVYGLTPSLIPHFHPSEVKMGTAPEERNGKILDVPMLVTAGDYVGVMTGTGASVSEAAKLAYSRLKRLEMPSSPIYRTDIGSRLKKELPLLQAQGYATNLSW